MQTISHVSRNAIQHITENLDELVILSNSHISQSLEWILSRNGATFNKTVTKKIVETIHLGT